MPGNGRPILISKVFALMFVLTVLTPSLLSSVYFSRFEIGTGTFGRVYLTKFRQNQTFYAMKVLKKSEVVRLKQVEHINSEKQILAQVHYPFIVNL
jgi:hypothetical protein